MKIILTALLLSTTCLSVATAGDFILDSKITSVTVFPKGAKITRTAKGEVSAGDHVIYINDLPNNIDPNSLRVEGVGSSALTIGSVDMKKIVIHGNQALDERRELENKVDVLHDEISSIKQTAKDDALQRDLLRALISKSTVSSGFGNDIKTISSTDIDSILSTAERRLQTMAGRAVKALARRREIEREISMLNEQISRLSPRDKAQTSVEINLNSAVPNDTVFNIKYAIHDAGWAPIYDANLTVNKSSSDATMQITRKANVYQRTSEKWNGVELVLSTARLSSATNAPDLRAWEINERRHSPSRIRKYSPALESQSMSKLKGKVMAEKKALSSEDIAQEVAVPAPVDISFSGFQAEYKIAGLTSVSNNQKTKSVIIGDDTMPVVLSAISAPQVDPTAYLVAKFKLENKVSFLPGTVYLSRNGAFIGKSGLPLLTPGEDFSLGFGQDDLIKIEHKEAGKKKGEAGFISTVKLDSRTFTTKIDYRHDFSMDVKILDRMPVANHEDIHVRLSSKTSKPTETNVDGKRGVLSWVKNMKPGESAKINFGYEISWPEGMSLNHVN